VDDTIKFSARDMNPRTASAAAFADVDNGDVDDDEDGTGGGEDAAAATDVLFLSNKLPVPHDVAGCALFQNVLLLPDILPPTPAVVGVWDVVVADSIMLLLPGVGGGDDMPVFIARFCD